MTTPTASGKTLIAMMAILKAIKMRRKAVYLTPLLALATEKYDDLKVLEKLKFERKIKVMTATGDYDSTGKELAEQMSSFLQMKRWTHSFAIIHNGLMM